MMSSFDSYDGTPPITYRRPWEIKADISRIGAEAREIEEMLTVRDLLLELVSSSEKSEPSKWIPELEEITLEAREALDRLTYLSERLDELREELKDSRWAMGF